MLSQSGHSSVLVSVLSRSTSTVPHPEQVGHSSVWSRIPAAARRWSRCGRCALAMTGLTFRSCRQLESSTRQRRARATVVLAEVPRATRATPHLGVLGMQVPGTARLGPPTC